MSETPLTTPPSSPISKEAEVKKPATATNGSPAKKFEGDGTPFKGKLIGMEDLSIDRDEKICLDSMFKLKAVVRARGEHKQRIQLNLTMTAVKIIDDTTKVQIACHEIERISFVVIDPRDNRAFGYIYNTSDDRHQFWAIKTERAAAATVLALKELFELAFEQYTNAEKLKEDANKTVTTTTTPPPPPVSSSEVTVQTQAPPAAAPVSPLPSPPPVSQLPQVDPIPSPTPPQISAPAPAPPVPAPVSSTTAPSILDGDIWGDSPSIIVPQPTQPAVTNLWDLEEPVIPVVQPAPKKVDPLEDLFNELSTTTTTTQPPPPATLNTNPLFDIFSNPAATSAPPPPPPTTTTTNQYANFYNQSAQPNLFNSMPTLSQQQQQRPATPVTAFGQQQDLLNPASMSPVAPPTVTSPFAGLDILGGLTTTTTTATTTGRTTKDAFFPATASKTIQQMQMERQP